MHIESFAADNEVDLTLIRWFLSLSPRERLQVLENHVSDIIELRDAKSKASISPNHSDSKKG